jgi:hypothetical protein
MLREERTILAPQPACQPSAFFCSDQNSHIVSVVPCHTTRCLSQPAAGFAVSGSGTASNASCSSGLNLSRITRTGGCVEGTL